MFESLQLNTIDYVALAFLGYGLIRGLIRGLASELARLASVGLAVLTGWHLYEPIGNKISEFTRLTGQDSYLAGFVLTAGAVALIMLLARWSMKQLMELAFNPVLNRVGGALAGLLRASLLLSALFIGMSLCRVDYLRTKFTEESVVGSMVKQHVMPVYESLTEDKPELRFEAEPPTDSKSQNHDHETESVE